MADTKPTVPWNYLIAVGISLLIGWLARQGVTPAPLPAIPPELLPGVVENQRATAEVLRDIHAQQVRAAAK